MAHEVPALPYDYAALEAAIDEQTMRIHHDKHHQAYVDNLNAALAGTEWADTPIEELLQSLDSLPEDKRTPVRNNGGGHYNHSLFWQSMSPDGGGDPPDGPLKDAIEQSFGDVASLKSTHMSGPCPPNSCAPESSRFRTTQVDGRPTT